MTKWFVAVAKLRIVAHLNEELRQIRVRPDMPKEMKKEMMQGVVKRMHTYVDSMI